MSGASREMTLKEYVEQLPSIHLARREYNKLGEIVRALCQIITTPSDEVITIDEHGNVTPEGAEVLRDPGPMDKANMAPDAEENKPDLKAENP